MLKYDGKGQCSVESTRVSASQRWKLVQRGNTGTLHFEYEKKNLIKNGIQTILSSSGQNTARTYKMATQGFNT